MFYVIYPEFWKFSGRKLKYSGNDGQLGEITSYNIQSRKQIIWLSFSFWFSIANILSASLRHKSNQANYTGWSHVQCTLCMILYASHNCEVIFALMVDVIKKIICLWNHISLKLAHIVNIIRQIILSISSDKSYCQHHLTNHIVNIVWQIILSTSFDKSYCQHHLTNHIVNIIWQIILSSSSENHIVNIIWQITLSISSENHIVSIIW